MLDVRRREFMALLGGTAAWPLTARAQQGERMRRIGFLQGLAENDPETEARGKAFRQALLRSDGPKAATSGSNIAMPPGTPLASRLTRPSW